MSVDLNKPVPSCPLDCKGCESCRPPTPPAWLQEAALTSPVAQAFLLESRLHGFSGDFFESMARALLTQNARLEKMVIESLSRSPILMEVGVGEISTAIAPKDRSPASARSGQQNEGNFGGSDGR